MRIGLVCTVLAVASVVAGWNVEPSSAQIWKHIVPASYVEEVPQGSVELTQEKGPWLIMVAAFSGDGAAEQAHALADELRTRHRLAGYVHERTFDHSDGRGAGRGLNQYGAPLRTRYQQEQTHEYAVLVGDYASNDDPAAQKALERIKSLPSQVLESDTPDSAMEEIRQVSATMLRKLPGSNKRGPMGGAFITRNPLLPLNFFVPKGVDPFLVKMNQGVEHSLLDCPGRFTVQVATFRGKTILQTGKGEPQDKGGVGWRWGNRQDDPLIEAAESAHLLTELLREHGFEAYEFHDRTESYVTIGSFDQVGSRLPNGQLAPAPEVQQIVQKFGAAYDTPADPLTGDDIRRARQADDLKRQFSQILSSHDTQVAAGMNPKHAKIMRGKKVDRIIPFDVYPHAIEVPKESISSAYAGQR
jgi:hypothetical protein